LNGNGPLVCTEKITARLPGELLGATRRISVRDVKFVKIPFSVIPANAGGFQGDSRNPDRYILDAGSSPA